MTRTLSGRTAVALTSLGLLLSACSASAADDASVATLAAGAVAADAGAAATDVDAEEAMLAFAQCMRDQGLDFADPTTEADGTLRFGAPGGGEGGTPAEGDREAQRAARDACSEHLEGLQLGGPGGRGQDEFDGELFLVYAGCMRDNGVADFPDPGADGRPDREAMQALDTTSAAFTAATQTCAAEVGFEAPAGGRGGPGGRGGAGGQG